MVHKVTGHLKGSKNYQDVEYTHLYPLEVLVPMQLPLHWDRAAQGDLPSLSFCGTTL